MTVTNDNDINAVINNYDMNIKPTLHIKEISNKSVDIQDKRRKKLRIPLALCLIAMAISGHYYLKSNIKLVEQKPQTQYFSQNYANFVSLQALIDNHSKQAHRRNLDALSLFEMKINSINDNYQEKLSKTVNQAAEKVSSYWSSSAIVYYLSFDKLKDTNKAENYINEQINPILSPVAASFADELQTAVNQLDFQLQSSTLKLATDLAAITPEKFNLDINFDPNLMQQADFQQSLSNLGYNFAATSLFIPTDIYAIYSLGQSGSLLSSLASKVFGNQIPKLAASGLAAASDGPLPIGDILAFAGVIWTGYDISKTRETFRRDISTSLDKVVENVRLKANEQIFYHATNLLNAYQEYQNDIGLQTINLSKKDDLL